MVYGNHFYLILKIYLEKNLEKSKNGLWYIFLDGLEALLQNKPFKTLNQTSKNKEICPAFSVDLI